MSADRLVNAAREYLDTVKAHSVASLPPSVLAREVAELRRLLGQVLDVITDYEDTGPDEDVTQPTLWGGMHLAPADAADVLAALLAAAHCCESHLSLPRAAARYRQMARQIGGGQ